MSFADIRATTLDWLNRSDCTVIRANGFVQQAQARIQRELRVPAMEKSVSAALDTNGLYSSINIPSDFLETQRVEADGRIIRATTPEHLLEMRSVSIATSPASSINPVTVAGTVVPGAPSFFARVQGQLLLMPFPTSYATLYYYGQFAPLIVDTDGNSLLDFGWDCLLFGALSYAGSFFRMDEVQEWEARYVAERDALRQLGQDADSGGGPMTVAAAYNGGYL